MAPGASSGRDEALFLKVEKAVIVVTAFLFSQPAGAPPLKPQTVAEGAELRSVVPGNKTPVRSRNVYPMRSLTTALVMAGRRPALRPRQRRLQPSQSATGGVGGPPASPQPPLQGRAAEGVERPGPSSSRHLRSAEGPVHIGPSPLSRKETSGLSPEEKPHTSSSPSTRKRSFCRLSASTHRKHFVTGVLAALGQTPTSPPPVCGSRRCHPSEWCYSRRAERRRR